MAVHVDDSNGVGKAVGGAGTTWSREALVSSAHIEDYRVGGYRDYLEWDLGDG